VEKVAKVDYVTLSVVRWFDNRAVTILSTFVGAQPVGETKRFSRVARAEQQVACPRVVRVYNAHMAGVDLLDSLIGLYRTHIRSKKWYHRIFFSLYGLNYCQFMAALQTLWCGSKQCYQVDGVA